MQRGLCQQELQDGVVALLLLGLADAALRIGNVAKNNRFRGTGLLAGRFRNRPFLFRKPDVAGVARLDLGRDFGLFDALQAEAAFFHDAAHADRDVGIFHQPGQLPLVFRQVALVRVFKPAHEFPFAVRCHDERAFVKMIQRAAVVIEKVKAADLVGTVVGTIPRANAAVVSHHVQTLVIVRGGIDRADAFAGGRFAMLAEHRLRHRLRVLLRPGIVAVDANPVHFAALADHFLADNRDVIFALTGDHAGGATDASVQINGHAPLVHGQLFWLHPAGSDIAAQ